MPLRSLWTEPFLSAELSPVVTAGDASSCASTFSLSAIPGFAFSSFEKACLEACMRIRMI